ncbi:MAG: hypothetical protein PHH77_12160 [Victivallaceae bacterium]|nr:hypothetical protein [Victivallaceae bacterium]
MSTRHKLKYLTWYAAAAAAVLFSGACTSTDSAEGSYQSANVYEKPLFGEIAMKSAAYEGPARNPVILIHGFLGASLHDKRTDKQVWGSFTGSQIWDGFTKDYCRQLACAMELGKPLTEIPDKLQAVRLLKNMTVKIMAVDFNIAAYQTIIDILENSGYVSESKPLPKNKKFYSLFTFYYDWRRDIAENAGHLHQFILVRRKYLQKKYEEYYGIRNFDVQFDIVAHSMGGLVTRYYLRYGDQKLTPKDGRMPKLDWRGSRYVDKAIIVGTPNAGYLDTCLELTQGLKLDRRLPLYPPGLVGTFPSYYEMMPVAGMHAVVAGGNPETPEVDMYDPKVWIANQWGLADPKQDNVLKALLPDAGSAAERRKIALDHLRKCLLQAKRFTRAMSIAANPPEDVMLILFVGDAVKTSRCATVDPATRELKVIKYDVGDGKVLASSARFDERVGRPWTPYLISPIKWQAVFNVQGAHMGIMDNYAFIDNLSYYLLAFSSPKEHAARLYFKKLLDNKK